MKSQAKDEPKTKGFACNWPSQRAVCSPLSKACPSAASCFAPASSRGCWELPSAGSSSGSIGNGMRRRTRATLARASSLGISSARRETPPDCAEPTLAGRGKSECDAPNQRRNDPPRLQQKITALRAVHSSPFVIRKQVKGKRVRA